MEILITGTLLTADFSSNESKWALPVEHEESGQDQATATQQGSALPCVNKVPIQGHYFQGTEAYVKAVNDGYFDLIELDFGATAQFDYLMVQTIGQSKKYDLIDKIPYRDSYGTGYFFIWRKR